MVLQHPKFIMSSDRDSENEQGTKCRIYNNKIHLIISDLSLDALTEVNNPDPFDVYLAKFCAITTIASETWFLINKRKFSNKSVCQFRQFLTSDFQRVFRSIHKIPKQYSHLSV